MSDRGISKTDRRVFERNLKRLYEAGRDEVIAYYTETNQDYNRVLDNLCATNEGSTKLTKSDLLLSMVTSGLDGVNARKKILDFVDRVNTQLTRRNDSTKTS